MAKFLHGKSEFRVSRRQDLAGPIFDHFPEGKFLNLISRTAISPNFASFFKLLLLFIQLNPRALKENT